MQSRNIIILITLISIVVTLAAIIKVSVHVWVRRAQRSSSTYSHRSVPHTPPTAPRSVLNHKSNQPKAPIRVELQQSSVPNVSHLTTEVTTIIDATKKNRTQISKVAMERQLVAESDEEHSIGMAI